MDFFHNLWHFLFGRLPLALFFLGHAVLSLTILGEQSKKEMSQIVEKVHKGGGGVKAKIKIVYISNVDYFD